MMKKILLVLAFALASCGKDEPIEEGCLKCNDVEEYYSEGKLIGTKVIATYSLDSAPSDTLYTTIGEIKVKRYLDCK